MTFTRPLAMSLGFYLLLLQTRGLLFKYPDNFAYFNFAASATDGNSLFLDGGEIGYANSEQTITLYVLGCTIYIDLTVPWNNDTVKLNYIPKPIHFPFTHEAVLWYNPRASEIQFFTGWWYDGNDDSDAWMCDGSAKARVIGPTSPALSRPWMWSLSYGDVGWAPTSPQPGVGVQPMRGALTTHSTDAVYALGTWFETYDNHNEIPDPGLMVYDFAQQQWHNKSSAGYGYEGRGYAAMGAAEYTDVFGDSGVLIFLSGYTPSGQFDAVGGNIQGNLQSFAQLYMYDISSQKFFTQSTSGRIPEARRAFCSVGVSEHNTTSLDIYIYGGFTGGGFDEPFSDSIQTVFVLSLPSFVWQEIPFSSESMRGGHTCTVAGQRQMIVFGGRDPTTHQLAVYEEPWPNAINVFDLSRWQWLSQYDPHAAPYKKNPALAKANAETPFPKTWDSDLAQSIFDPKGASNKHNGGTVGGGSSTGAIAGGIVGGVVVLFIIPVIGWFVWKRRKSSRSAAAAEVEYSKPELDSYGSAENKSWAASSPLHEIDSSSPMPELAQNHGPHELEGGYSGWDSRST